MNNLELTNMPDELLSQKPVIAAHRIDVYSNFKSKEERKKKRASKKARRIEKRAIAKEERKGMPLGKRLLNLSQKANPAAVVPRSSFLLGLRMNIFGMARRLYPATLTDEEIKKKGLDPENAKRAKEVIEKKFAPVWLALGGRKISLYENIKKGFDRPIFKTKKMKQAKKDIQESEKIVASKKSSSFIGDADDNSLYNPHKVQGVLYRLYIDKPIVEPFHNFDANQIDLGIDADKMNLGIDGTGSMDLSEMRTNSDCAACSSIEGDGDLSKAEEIDLIDNFSNATGYDDAAIAAYISAGLSIAGGLVKMLNNNKVAKNPYKQGTSEYNKVEQDNEQAEKEGATTPPPVNESAMKEIKAAASEDAKKGISEEEIAKEESAVQKEIGKDIGADDKILGINKTVFWSGVVLLGLGAAFAVYKMRGKGASVPKV